jgi:uncharacterized protein (TIGR02231 family)
MLKRAVPWLTLCSLFVLFAALMQQSPVSPVVGKEPAVVDPNLQIAFQDPASANPNAKAVTSRVVGVTVYPNSALVTREVDVPAGAGTMELNVRPLPIATVQSSLFSEGSEGVRVLQTRFRTRPVLEDTREDVKKFNDELKQLQIARDKIEADVRANQANGQLLTKLENVTQLTNVPQGDKSAINSEAIITTVKYIMEQRATNTKEGVALQQQVKENQEKTDLARKKLNDLVGSAAKIEHDAVIVVEKTNAAAGKMRLNYLVDSASWSPQYKFRGSKNTKDQVQLEYLAAVIQNTGEDWSNVKLVLSTAKPMLNAAPPELQSLQVTVVPKTNGAPKGPNEMELEEQVKNLRTKAQKDFNAGKDSSGIGLVNTAAALDQSWELLNPEEAVKRGCSLATREGPSVSYHLNTKLTVPSRLDEQVIEVAKIEMPPDYYYKAVPILTTHVYRLAEMTNRSELVLLPGDATMYVGGDFVGQMNLPLVAIGEKFTVGFGVDPALQVQRQMIDRSRTIQGGNQSLRYDFRILVNSYKSERIKLQVWDRLPHPETDAVNVAIAKTTPELSKDALYVREQRPNNLLRWDVSVDPGMAGEKALAITYELKLELDRQMSISSFHSPGVFASVPTPSHVALPPMSPSDIAKIKAQMGKLSPEDRQAAERQVFCAIDQDSPLGSTGPILKVNLKGQPVFFCCKGCEAEAKAHPEEAFVKFQQLMNRIAPPKK